VDAVDSEIAAVCVGRGGAVDLGVVDGVVGGRLGLGGELSPGGYTSGSTGLGAAHVIYEGGGPQPTIVGSQLAVAGR